MVKFLQEDKTLRLLVKFWFLKEMTLISSRLSQSVS